MPTRGRSPSPPWHRYQRAADRGNSEATRIQETRVQGLARYPHDEVNHLSCNEARNYYGGVVSLIPVVLDLLQQGVTSSQRAQRKLAAEQGSEPARSSRAGPLSNTTATQAGSGAVKGGCSPDNEAGPWDTTKPAWRPPGPINKH
ncbi:UNVERIFIED_CONTAM: hypothetical protein FKN15_061899 [Acipenser sinensis]